MDLHVIILLIGLPVATVLLVIEYRIIRKPRSQRSSREQKFMDSDVKASAAYRMHVLRFLPPITAVFAAVVMLVTIPLWLAPRHVSLAIVITVGALLICAASIVATVFFRSSKGRRWIDETNARFALAADQSRPKWFISGNAGLGVGALFGLFGVSGIILQLIRPGASSGFVLPAVLLGFAAAAFVGAVAQRRTERSG